MVTAFDLVGEEIFRRLGPTRVLPLGTMDLTELLQSSGHDVVSIDEWAKAEAVVVGNDPAFDFARLRAASRAVAAGAAFFAVNMDARFPVAEDQFDPGCGALAEAVAVAAEARPIAFGKPHRPLFDVTIARLGCEPRQAAMVGDNLASDIKGGRAAGMFTIWINAQPHAIMPAEVDLEVGSLSELLDLWRSLTGRGLSPLGRRLRPLRTPPPATCSCPGFLVSLITRVEHNPDSFFKKGTLMRRFLLALSCSMTIVHRGWIRSRFGLPTLIRWTRCTPRSRSRFLISD